MNNPKRVIVLGATSGIGLASVKEMCNRGWIVGIAGRRGDVLKQIYDSNDNVVSWRIIDVTSSDATDNLDHLISDMGGNIDLYLHSSGIGYQNIMLDEEKEIATIQTNALGMTRMILHMFKYFENRKNKEGHIAVISSIAGTKGLGAAPAYSSTKRFVNHYLECLTQLTHIRNINNITITDIRPGFVKTPLLKGEMYPMQLDVYYVAKSIVNALEKKKKIVTIDWKYSVLVFFWRLIPHWLWIRLRIK